MEGSDARDEAQLLSSMQIPNTNTAFACAKRNCSLPVVTSPIGADSELDLAGRKPVALASDLPKRRAGGIGLYVTPQGPVKRVQEVSSQLDAEGLKRAEVLL
jgi:hypothetical protein